MTTTHVCVWDAHADEVFSLARMSPHNASGTGTLVRRLFGVASIRRVDRVPPGECLLSFDSTSGIERPRPVRVNVATVSRVEQWTLACARACARYLAWSRGEAWTREAVDGVALSVAMPRQIVDVRLSQHATAYDLAEEFVVDPSVAGDRLRGIGGVPRSGEHRLAVLA